MSTTLRAALTPRLVGAHVVALVLVAIATGLGVWQLQAWSAQREAEAVDLTQEAPRPLSDVITPDDGFPTDALGRPVTVEGTWQPDDSLVVSGRGTNVDEPGDGYWAVTPVAVTGTDAQLLVVRGWASEIDQLSAAPTGAVELVARLQPSQAESGVPDNPGDRVLAQLRIADAVQLTDANLYGGYAVAAGPLPQSEGLAEVTVPANAEVGPFTAIQNLLYAVEWWIFGAFAAFVWWRFTRDAVVAVRAEGDEPGDGLDPGGDPEDDDEGAGDQVTDSARAPATAIGSGP